MGRPGITREQVFEAADSIANEGVTPTVMSVRTRLGGGSPNNITKWLGEWKEQNEASKVEALPPLPEGVESAMRQVWGSAWKGAKVQLEAEREALSTARKEIEKERNEMLSEIGRLDGELEEARAEMRKRSEGLETERRAHDKTRSEVREAQAIAAEREKRIGSQEAELREVRHQAAQAEAKVSRLEADLSYASKDLEAARAEAGREADTRATVERERDRMRSDNEHLMAELRTARETTKQAKAALDLGGKKLQKLEADIEEERKARAAAEKALAELRVEAATLKERAAHAEELRGLLQEFQKQTPGKPVERTRKKKEADTPKE